MKSYSSRFNGFHHLTLPPGVAEGDRTSGCLFLTITKQSQPQQHSLTRHIRADRWSIQLSQYVPSFVHLWALINQAGEYKCLVLQTQVTRSNNPCTACDILRRCVCPSFCLFVLRYSVILCITKNTKAVKFTQNRAC